MFFAQKRALLNDCLSLNEYGAEAVLTLRCLLSIVCEKTVRLAGDSPA